MGVLNEQAGSCSGKYATRRSTCIWVLPLLILFLGLGISHSSWAVQQHVLVPGEGTVTAPPGGGQPAVPQPAPAEHATDSGHADTMAPQAQPQIPKGHGTPTTADVKKPAQTATGAGQAVAPPTEAAPADHGAKPEAHGEGHGPALPALSPIPGVTFVETMIKLMEDELHGRFLGWRPNDIVIGRFTDNINKFQLGVLEAMRFTTIRLKDSLTRMGDADTYDPDLEKALNLFMNSSTKFWFPSAESSYGEAIDHLKLFVEKLKTGKRHFYYRKDNLVLLLASYRDLLGNVNKTLIASPVSFFDADDYFSYARGVAHVYYEIIRVIRVGFQNQLSSTIYGLEMLDEVIHELHKAEQIDPWIILDGDLGGFFANHRANLNAPLSETNHLLVVLSQL